MRRRVWVHGSVLLFVVGASYVVGAKLAFVLLTLTGLGAALFLPAGVVLAALITTPLARWPFVLAGAALAESWLDWREGLALDSTSGFVLANLLGPLTGASLVRWRNPRFALTTPTGMGRFIIFGVCAGPIVSAAIGATTVTMTRDAHWTTVFAHWWVGDSLGALVLGSAIIAALSATERHRVRSIEAALALAAMLGLSSAIAYGSERPLYFLTITILVWAAFRLGVLAVSVLGLGMALTMTVATANGHGFWGTIAPDGLIYLQLFFGVIIATSLVLAVASLERERAIEARLQSESERDEARRRAQSADRSRALAGDLAAAGSIEEVAAALSGRLRALLDADGASLYLGEGSSQALIAVAHVGPGGARASNATRHEIQAFRSGSTTTSGDGSRVAVPMLAEGRPIAVVGLTRPPLGPLTADQQRVVDEAADQGAAAIQRARLFEAERLARQRAETLENVASRLASTTSSAAVGAAVVEGAAVGGIHVELGLLEGEDLRCVAASGTTPVRGGFVEPCGAVLQQAVAQQTTIAVATPAELALRYPDGALSAAPGWSVQSLLALPLRHAGHVRGSLLVGFEREHQATSLPNRAFASALAALIAQGIERVASIEREHDVAVRLQRALLPGTLDEPEGLTVAFRYVAGQDHMEVGGDWYELFARPDGRVALAVGDVVGRGVGAAAVMGRLRSGFRAIGLTAVGPKDLLEHLDLFAADIDDAQFSTLCCAVLDPSTGALDYSHAGHPPMLVVDPHGHCSYLEGARSGPVGATRTARESARAELEAGSTLLLYSDGLIERRGECLDVGFARLLASAARHRHQNVATLCESLLADLVGTQELRDDIVVLAIRFDGVPSPAPLLHRFPARAEELASTRRVLREWMAGHGLPHELQADLLLTVGEACSNSVEHAYLGCQVPGEVEIQARTGPDHVECRVTDHGQWRVPSAPGPRGRGLSLIRLLGSGELRRSPEGTTVVIRFPLADGLPGSRRGANAS